MSDRNKTNEAPSPKTLEEIKAEARAYALGQTTRRPNATDSAARPGSAVVPRASTSLAPAPEPIQRDTTTTTTSTEAVIAANTKDSGQQSTLRSPQPSPPLAHKDELGDVYAHFVNLLGQDDDQTNLSFLMLDDDEEFQFDPDSFDDEDDDDEDEEEEEQSKLAPTEGNSILLSPLPIWDSDNNVARQLSLQEELNLLEEEDMQAAVATLLEHPPDNNNNNTNAMDDDDGTHHGISSAQHSAEEDASMADESADPTVVKQRTVSSAPRPTALLETSATTSPIREAARLSHRVIPTLEQQELLRSLLEKHHQLLLQQTVLAVRAANSQSRRRVTDYVALPTTATPEFVNGGESGEDLVEVLDSAVGMLQDLDQNRKDAIRSEIQLDLTISNNSTTAVTSIPKHSLVFGSRKTATKGDRPSAQFDGHHDRHDHHMNPASGRPLTRAQFTRALLEQNTGQARTVFDVQGLSKQKETFNLIDTSVDGKRLANTNILLMETNANACEYLLSHCGATIDADMIPGARDLSTNFVDIREYLGQDFTPPCTHSQELMLKRNRNLFTAGEDNLVLRGVNLYGEKQWMLISDRFMPERSINIISQRHGTLCYMLYKSRGIEIDEYGELAEPPKHDSVDDVDMEAVKTLEKVPPPAILNVHRWSMDEDLILLKAVPLFGPMWAEIRVRMLPHRDRGHIRKRYQVLERRIKATWNRIKKQSKVISFKLAKSAASVSTSVQPIAAAAAPTLATTSRTSMRRAPASSPQKQGDALPLPSRRTASAVQHNVLPPADGAAAAAIPQYMMSPVPLPQAMMGSPGQVPVLHPPVYGYPPPPYAVSHGYPMYPAPSYYYIPVAYHQPYSHSPPPPHHGDGHMQGNSHGPWSPMQTEQQQPYRMENETEAATTMAGLASNANQPLANNESQNPSKRLKTQELSRTHAQNHYDSSYPPIGSFESPDKASRASGQTGTTPLPLFSPSQLSLGIALHGSENLAAGLNENTLDGFDLQAAMLAADTNDTSQGVHHEREKHQSSPDGSPPQHKPLFGDEATLMENDLEAISALNSLSRSRGSPATDAAASVPDGKPRATASKKTANSGQSLFAKVVGEANEKNKSRSSKRKRVQ